MKYYPDKNNRLTTNSLKVGDIVNKWTILSKNSRTTFLCICSCGLIRDVNCHNLARGASKSCGKGQCVSIDRSTQPKAAIPCVVCGKTIQRLTNQLTKKNTCSDKCRSTKNNRGVFIKRRESPLGTLAANLPQIKTRCKKKGLEFELTEGYLEQLYVQQKGRCALTGDVLIATDGLNQRSESISVDRIDSTKGYVLGNIQLTTRVANVAKNTLSVHDFVSLCRKVVEHARQDGFG